MNANYAQPKMIYSPNDSQYESLESFHEHARRLGHYPKVGLFVDDMDERELCSPSTFESPTHPTSQRRPSPSLMSRTLDARAEADAADRERLARVQSTLGYRPPWTSAIASMPSYRQTHARTPSEDDVPSSPSACSVSDSGSEYDGDAHPEPEPTPPKTTSRSSRTRSTKTRTTPYRKANSPTQSRIASCFSSSVPPSPVSSDSSCSATSTLSITASSSASSGSEVNDDGMSYTTTRDRNGKVKYTCKTHKTYTTHAMGDLTRHLESREHVQPGHWCVSECGKAFTRKDSILRHLRSNHSGCKIGYDEGTQQAFWKKSGKPTRT